MDRVATQNKPTSGFFCFKSTVAFVRVEPLHNLEVIIRHVIYNGVYPLLFGRVTSMAAPCAWSHWTICANGHFEIVQWLHSHGAVPWTSRDQITVEEL